MGTEGIQISRSPGGLGTPRLSDLDGVGRPEVLFAGEGQAGAGRAIVVFVRGQDRLALSSTIVPGVTTGR